MNSLLVGLLVWVWGPPTVVLGNQEVFVEVPTDGDGVMTSFVSSHVMLNNGILSNNDCL